MEKKESEKGSNGFLSPSTYVGYKYLMTSSLSQDSIENLFGIVRTAKGCNDHPTLAEF